MAPSSSSFKVGDQVWVKTGVAVSASGEELGTILSLPTTPQARKAKKNCNTDNTTNTNNEEVSRDRDDCIVIKYTVSGYEVLMTDYNRIRHMAPTAVDETDGKGRKLRRSGRSSNSNPTSVLMNLGGTATPSTGTKKFVANGAADTNNDVTPSANGGDGDEVMEDYNSSKLPAAKKKKETKKRKPVARKPTAAASIKKAKIQMSSSPLKGEATSVNGEKNGKGSPYFAKEQSKSSNTNEEEKGEEVPAQEKKKKKAAPKKSGGRTSKLIMAPSSDSEGDQLDNDNVEAEMDEKGGGKRNGNKKKPVVGVKTSAKKPASKGKNATASASSKTKPAAAKATATATQNKKKQSKTKKQSAASSETICIPCSVPSEGNQPDGNGGLNQASPWIVEYSKTGRATCRSCDDKIGKGDVRVGHTPLFRGKVSFSLCHDGTWLNSCASML